MIGWHSIAIAALFVPGVAACGIGAISLVGGVMSEDLDEAAKAERGGLIVGSVGLALLYGALLVRAS